MTIEVAVAPVGEYIADELSSRGWTQAEFAEILGRPPQFVSEVITGKKEITRESAAQIGAAFATSADMWLSLQDRYYLWRQQLDGEQQSELTEVRLRARLKELAPIAILRQRGVITSPTLAGQAEQLRELLELETIDDSPTFAAAARRSNPAELVSAMQISWLACVRHRARALDPAKYARTAFIKLIEQLSSYLATPAHFRDSQRSLQMWGFVLSTLKHFHPARLMVVRLCSKVLPLSDCRAEENGSTKCSSHYSMKQPTLFSDMWTISLSSMMVTRVLRWALNKPRTSTR